VTFSVYILRSAQKQLAKINRQDRLRIISSIKMLAENPRPEGCKKLSGRPAWRIRIGSYRVLYEIHDKRLLVLVISVGHRKNIYK